MLLPLLPLLPSLPLPVPYRNESIMVNQTSDSDQCYTSQNQIPYPYEECTTNAKTQKLTRHFYATLSLPIFSNLSAWRNNDITFFPLQISIYIQIYISAYNRADRHNYTILFLCYPQTFCPIVHYFCSFFVFPPQRCICETVYV